MKTTRNVAARAYAVGLSALLISACSHHGVAIGGDAAKAEVRERKERCDTIARSLEPDRSGSGSLSVLSFGLEGEYRVDHVNNVKDEYLTALQGLLVDCREWQRSAISNREWMEARRRYSLVYTSRLDAASVDGALQKLSDVFTSGIGDQSERAQAIQSELTSLREARENDRQTVEDHIRELTQQLEGLRADLRVHYPGSVTPTSTPPHTPADMTPVPTGRPDLRVQWAIRFAVQDAAPDSAQLEQIAAALQALKAREPTVRFELTGFADTNGDERSNLLLAVRRVQAVRRALDDRGVHGATAVAVGETEIFGQALGANRIVLIAAYFPASSPQSISGLAR